MKMAREHGIAHLVTCRAKRRGDLRRHRPITVLWATLLHQCLLLVGLGGCPLSGHELPYTKIVLAPGTYSVELIQNSSLDETMRVRSLSIGYAWVINGGYYDAEQRPSGYLKIAGTVIQSTIASNLSGLLVFNDPSDLQLCVAHHTDPDAWTNVLQNGPCLVDPGGRIGIRKSDGKQANRTCIGKRRNGDILLMYSSRISLLSLAESLLANEPELDCVVNLDGGPMAGLWATNDPTCQFENSRAAINYLGFHRKTISDPH